MIRRPPRSTLDRSSAASDVYKRQEVRSTTNDEGIVGAGSGEHGMPAQEAATIVRGVVNIAGRDPRPRCRVLDIVLVDGRIAVSYTHLRAHETVLDLVCRLLLDKKHHHLLYPLSQMST